MSSVNKRCHENVVPRLDFPVAGSLLVAGERAFWIRDLIEHSVRTLVNMTKEVQSLFTLAHTQVALTNSLMQYVLTCVVEPPEDVLPATRARAKARYAKILRLAGQEVATRNRATLEEVLTHSKNQ